MNCGCILKGNPFDGNQMILEACVLHIAWAGEKVKEKELQYSELKTVSDLDKERKFRIIKERDDARAQINQLREELRKVDGHGEYARVTRDKAISELQESNRLNDVMRKALKEVEHYGDTVINEQSHFWRDILPIVRKALEETTSEKRNDEAHECWVEGGICPVDGTCTCWCHQVKV